MAEAEAPRSVVVLGATSAIARALANEFAARKYVVLLGARDMEETGLLAADIRVRHDIQCDAVPFDAEDTGSHHAFLQACREKLGEMPGGVVVCFGFLSDQKAAESNFDLALQTINLNLTFAVSILEVFAAAFETRRSGFTVGISSVAGDRGRQTIYIYGAAKGGFTIYLQGLRNRLHKSGVAVTTIKPGFIDTKMTYGLPLPRPLVASPEQAARAIYRAIERKKHTVYVPFFWRYIMLLIKLIPEWQFKKMKI